MGAAEQGHKAIFRCRVCGAPAGSIQTFTAPEIEAIPEAERKMPLSIFRSPSFGILVVEGLAVHALRIEGEAEWAQIQAAVTSGAPRSVYGVRPDFAPFYCEACECCYCRDHWDEEVQWEDGSWYDCTYGTCPEGHRRIVDD